MINGVDITSIENTIPNVRPVSGTMLLHQVLSKKEQDHYQLFFLQKKTDHMFFLNIKLAQILNKKPPTILPCD